MEDKKRRLLPASALAPDDDDIMMIRGGSQGLPLSLSLARARPPAPVRGAAPSPNSLQEFSVGTRNSECDAEGRVLRRLRFMGNGMELPILVFRFKTCTSVPQVVVHPLSLRLQLQVF